MSTIAEDKKGHIWKQKSSQDSKERERNRKKITRSQTMIKSRFIKKASCRCHLVERANGRERAIKPDFITDMQIEAVYATPTRVEEVA